MPRFPDFIDDGVGGIVAIDIVDDDIRAGLAERNRYSLADAGICAGDQRLLPGKDLGDGHRRRSRGDRRLTGFIGHGVIAPV